MNDSPATPDISSAPPGSALSDRTLAVWEIASVASSVVIAEWMLASAAGFSKAVIAVPVATAILLMFVSHRVRREGWRELGFRFDTFLPALYLLAVPVLLVAGACLLIAWTTGSSINFLRWHPNRNLGLQLAIGFAWALAQQYVLQGFFNRRAMIALGRGWFSVSLIGVIFALLHLPNPWLTLITLIAGGIWAAVYQRAPNLIALALTHAVMTWFIVSTLPASMLRHLRVGLGYFG